MNIIIIICSFILPIISFNQYSFNMPALRAELNKMEPLLCASKIRKDVKQMKPKLCIHCKYFIPSNASGIDKFGKCALFKTEEGKIDYLVTGETEQKYYYCSTSRDSNDMCGEEGKYYKKKIVRNKHMK